MNATVIQAAPEFRRQQRHRHLHNASWCSIAFAIAGAVSLVPYAYATIHMCGGLIDQIGWCEMYSSLPWFSIVLVVAAYSFVLYTIHELGHESAARPGENRVAWSQARLGYRELEKGYHRMVRRTHRMTAIALAAVAAYISFQFFEADTLTNLSAAAAVFVVGEILNWKTYTKLMQNG